MSFGTLALLSRICGLHFLAVLGSAHLFHPVNAAGIRDAQPLSAEDHLSWQAIGRVNRAGFKSKSLCSGALVAPSWVLTAAHCVPRAASDDDFVFVAGWYRETQKAVRRAKRVIRQGANGQLQDDVALIELDSPIQDVAPFRVRRSQVAATLAYVSYSGDRPYALAGRFDCASLPAPKGLIFTDCAVVSGNSGAPFLVKEGAAWQVVGVVSARAERADVRSIGVIPDLELLANIYE